MPVGSMAQPIRPVSEEVARPVNAPNYPGMYSEAIRGALAPGQFLLDTQKELSEEDERKAQIQNWLTEADLKQQDLKETTRSHMADEASKALTVQLEGRKVDEEVRHDQASELHDSALADIEKQRMGIESSRAEEEKRRDDMADKRATALEQERERADKAKEDYDKHNLQLMQQSHQAYINEQDAKTKELNDAANDKINDQNVLERARKWRNEHTPEELWNSGSSPEVQNELNDFRTRLKTQQGRQDFDFLLGEHSMLGKEMEDRKTFDSMGNEGKSAFVSEMNSNKNGKDEATGAPLTIQQRWDRALQQGNKVNWIYQNRMTWTPKAQQAFDEALHLKKSPEEAYSAGKTVQDQYEKTLHEKAAPGVPGKAALDFYSRLFPPNAATGEDVDSPGYQKRLAQKAADMEKLKEDDPDEYYRQIGGGTQATGSKDKILQSLFKPQSSAAPSSSAPESSQPGVENQEVQPRINMPAQPGSRLAQSTARILPTSATETENLPQYAQAQGDLRDQFEQYFSGLGGAGPSKFTEPDVVPEEEEETSFST